MLSETSPRCSLVWKGDFFFLTGASQREGSPVDKLSELSHRPAEKKSLDGQNFLVSRPAASSSRWEH